MSNMMNAVDMNVRYCILKFAVSPITLDHLAKGGEAVYDRFPLKCGRKG